MKMMNRKIGEYFSLENTEMLSVKREHNTKGVKGIKVENKNTKQKCCQVCLVSFSPPIISLI